MGTKLLVLFYKMTKMLAKCRYCSIKKQFYPTLCRYFKKKHYFCAVIDKIDEKIHHK